MDDPLIRGHVEGGGKHIRWERWTHAAQRLVTIFVFVLILFGGFSYPDKLGSALVAVMGAAIFLIAGLVRWEEINSGVNWGVVLLWRRSNLPQVANERYGAGMGCD